MKKVIGIAVIMLLACAVMASATATNWFVTVKATDSTGGFFGTAAQIGTNSAYTDGIDTGSKGEPGTIAPTPDATTLGNAIADILGDGSTQASRDFRTPVAEGTSKTWSVRLFTSTVGVAPAYGPLHVTITLATGANAPAYLVGATAYQFTFGGAFHGVYTATTPLPSVISFDIAQPKTSWANADILTCTFAPTPNVPEPGGLVALGSGLVGLVGFAIRRRRS